jgi:hypothetical protein
MQVFYFILGEIDPLLIYSIFDREYKKSIKNFDEEMQKNALIGSKYLYLIF